MINSFVYKIYSKKTLNRLEAKVRQLGINNNFNLNLFLSIRLILTIFIFIYVLINNKYGYLISPILSIFIYWGLEYLLIDVKIKERATKLEKESLFFFEILALSLEGGQTLHHALKLTSENVECELSLEFKQVLNEVRLSKSLNDSLNDAKKRIPSVAINNVILQIIEANSFGTNIIDSMYNQISYLREKQILDIKAKINKLPTKISVISVLFIIPIMLLVILSPVIINFINK